MQEFQGNVSLCTGRACFQTCYNASQAGMTGISAHTVASDLAGIAVPGSNPRDGEPDSLEAASPDEVLVWLQKT